MKKDKMGSTIFCVASLLFYLAAFISFFSENGRGSVAVWLSLGTVFLCLGAEYKKKRTKDKDDSKVD